LSNMKEIKNIKETKNNYFP